MFGYSLPSGLCDLTSEITSMRLFPWIFYSQDMCSHILYSIMKKLIKHSRNKWSTLPPIEHSYKEVYPDSGNNEHIKGAAGWALLTGGTKERPLRTRGRLAGGQMSPPARQKYCALLVVADLTFPGLRDNVVLCGIPGFLRTHHT